MHPSALQKFRDNPALMTLYMDGMSALWQSGVLAFLRENGRIGPVSPESPNYVEYQNAVANWSIGFQTCLDQLMYFKEMFIDDASSASKVQMDFGSVEAAVEKGDLTREEADAIRAGK